MRRGLEKCKYPLVVNASHCHIFSLSAVFPPLFSTILLSSYVVSSIYLHCLFHPAPCNYLCLYSLPFYIFIFITPAPPYAPPLIPCSPLCSPLSCNQLTPYRYRHWRLMSVALDRHRWMNCVSNSLPPLHPPTLISHI